MVEVKNLTKKYGNFEAVKDVSFKVEKGKILGFLGPNGAGKTTTMRMITTYMPPTDGTAIIDGYDIIKNPKEVRKIIGYLPEIPPLYEELKVVEYLKYVGKLKGMSKSKIKERLEYVVSITGLKEVSNKLIAQLSKGFKQRVGIAQAIIHDPHVVILDEPTIGLDPNQVIEVRKLIKSLAGEHTVILSTHILPEVTMTCDDVVIINKGEVVAADSIENLTTTDHGNISVKVRVENGEGLETIIDSVNGVIDVNPVSEKEFVLEFNDDSAISDVSEIIIKNGYKLLDFHKEAVSLETIFSSLTIGS